MVLPVCCVNVVSFRNVDKDIFVSEISCGKAPVAGYAASSTDEHKTLLYMDTAVYNCDPGFFIHTHTTIGLVSSVTVTCLADKTLDKITPVFCKGEY